MRFARLAAVALVAIGCSSSPAATPIIIYVTPPPTPAPTLAPTAAVTPSPSPSPSPTSTTHTLQVQVALLAGSDMHYTGTGDGCVSAGPYSDVAPGMQATIKDANGNILGIAEFETPGTSPSLGECDFTATATNIPEVPFYAVDLGRRGSVQFSLSELEQHGWVAGLSIGNTN